MAKKSEKTQVESVMENLDWLTEGERFTICNDGDLIKFRAMVCNSVCDVSLFPGMNFVNLDIVKLCKKPGYDFLDNLRKKTVAVKSKFGKLKFSFEISRYDLISRYTIHVA